MTTSYVALVSAGYPTQHRCGRCHVALRIVHGLAFDHAGARWCWTGLTEHQAVEVPRDQPVITPSPLLTSYLRGY